VIPGISLNCDPTPQHYNESVGEIKAYNLGYQGFDFSPGKIRTAVSGLVSIDYFLGK
jgi:hypothetical protein